MDCMTETLKIGKPYERKERITHQRRHQRKLRPKNNTGVTVTWNSATTGGQWDGRESVESGTAVSVRTFNLNG